MTKAVRRVEYATGRVVGKSRSLKNGGRGMGAWMAVALMDSRVEALNHRDHRALTVALLHWANDTGQFWPKQATWAEKSGMTLSALKRAVESLEAAGLLHRQRHLGPGARGEVACTYTLLIEAPGSPRVDYPGDPGVGDLEQGLELNESLRTGWSRAGARDQRLACKPESTAPRSSPRASKSPQLKAQAQSELRQRPGSPMGGLPTSLDPELQRILGSLHRPGAGALTTEEISEIEGAFGVDADKVAAVAWKAAVDPSVRVPSRVLAWRLSAAGDPDGGWASGAMDEWCDKGSPRPWDGGVDAASAAS